MVSSESFRLDIKHAINQPTNHASTQPARVSPQLKWLVFNEVVVTPHGLTPQAGSLVLDQCTEGFSMVHLVHLSCCNAQPSSLLEAALPCCAIGLPSTISWGSQGYPSGCWPEGKPRRSKRPTPGHCKQWNSHEQPTSPHIAWPKLSQPTTIHQVKLVDPRRFFLNQSQNIKPWLWSSHCAEDVMVVQASKLLSAAKSTWTATKMPEMGRIAIWTTSLPSF